MRCGGFVPEDENHARGHEYERALAQPIRRSVAVVHRLTEACTRAHEIGDTDAEEAEPEEEVECDVPAWMGEACSVGLDAAGESGALG